MGDVIDINSRRKEVPGKKSVIAPSDLKVFGIDEHPGLIMFLVFLVKSPEEVQLITEKVELIGKIKSSCSISARQRAKALETISNLGWGGKEIAEQLIGADENLIKTKPVLFIVALEKLLGELMQL
ncbi:MAG: hypothetical protein P4L62_02505 [Candidatus Pacebacteria bacterium]|nr:hypothetical protein [Candidatus Paceibacterota bacterium]MDR3583205.1 hypothetical protein [Candidatus Paceibacterota bacterium]